VIRQSLSNIDYHEANYANLTMFFQGSLNTCEKHHLRLLYVQFHDLYSIYWYEFTCIFQLLLSRFLLFHHFRRKMTNKQTADAKRPEKKSDSKM
jgi:hypothetical protein